MFPEVKKNGRIKIYTRKKTHPEEVNGGKVSQYVIVTEDSEKHGWNLHFHKHALSSLRAPLVAQLVKNLPATWETWVQLLGWEDPLEEEMATTPVFLPGESHRQRSLVVHSPWGCKELDTTERLSTAHYIC